MTSTGAASLERHESKVQRIARSLAARPPGVPVSFRKKAVAHQVPKRNDRTRNDEKIDLDDLDEILELDPKAMTCTAEPGVTFTDLVSATLPHGLVPLIVPELRTITIGGAVAGCSIESMSFKHGGFHDSCLEYEVITAKGDVLHCTPDNEHGLVFQMMHGSFGTLGILSKLKFRLVPAKPFVRLEHHMFSTLKEYKDAIFRHFEAQDVDFMDGFIFPPTPDGGPAERFVLSLGFFVSEAPYTSRYDWTKVYFLSTVARKTDYLETSHYFFRYDHGVTNVHPKSFLGRLFFGKFFGSARLLRGAEWVPRLIPEKPDVTIDLFIPFSKLDAFLAFYERSFEFRPLWVVPYKRVRDYEWVSKEFVDDLTDSLFIDLAIYGMKQEGGRNYYKEIEDELQRLGALKTLISHNYYDEATFWKIWNKPNYDAVKKITDPDNIFRDLWSKTCRATQGLD
jgi:hypothetical protein